MAGDLSLSGHTLNWAGGITTIGEEVVFDGTDDHIYAADSANWQFGGDFTIEVFGVKFAHQSSNQWIISQWDAGAGHRVFVLNLSTTGLSFSLSTDGSTSSSVSDTWAPTLNQAYDLCVDRSGSTVRLYIDGVMLTSGTISGAAHDGVAPLSIGANRSQAGSLGSLMTGRLKAFRITKGTARYASDGGYTVPTLPLPTS